MNLLVLGASGGCGRWVVRLGAERSHTLTAVVRPSSGWEAPDGVDLVRGDVTDPAFLIPLLRDHGVVISCLGLRRAGLRPWSRLLSPPDLVQRVARIVCDAIGGWPDPRFLWISAGGVGASSEYVAPLVQRLIGSWNVGVAYRDLEAAERILTAGAVHHLAVRPVTLRPGAPTGRAHPIERYGTLSTIRRGDVAHWMLDVADGSRSYSGSEVLLG